MASIILPTAQGSSSTILDELYSKSSKRFVEVEAELSKKPPQAIVKDFIKIYDEINKILSISEKTFVRLLFSSPKDKVSRYYIVLFLSFYNLMIKENLIVSNYKDLIDKLNNLYEKDYFIQRWWDMEC